MLLVSYCQSLFCGPLLQEKICMFFSIHDDIFSNITTLKKNKKTHYLSIITPFRNILWMSSSKYSCSNGCFTLFEISNTDFCKYYTITLIDIRILLLFQDTIYTTKTSFQENYKGFQAVEKSLLKVLNQKCKYFLQVMQLLFLQETQLKLKRFDWIKNTMLNIITSTNRYFQNSNTSKSVSHK